MAKYGVSVTQQIDYYFEVEANNDTEALQAYEKLIDQGNICWNDYENGSSFEVWNIERTGE